MIERVVIRGYRCFSDLDFEPNPGLNVVVGDNEAGKSTLLEAIALALTGRSNGRWMGDEINPFWFHRATVLDFFARIGTDDPAPPPEISIEVFLSGQDDVFQPLRGVHNSLNDDAPGIRVHAAPADDYRTELRKYLDSDPPAVLPVEFYAVEWAAFSGERIARRPKALATSFIDSRTIRSTSGIDFHTREILSSHLADAERVEISLAHRQARQRITDETLADINARIAKASEEIHHRPLGLQMDQSSRASWESGIVPQVDDIPFAMSGQGQQAAIKIALAMSQSAGIATFVLVEEPENHLSHTSLARLVRRIGELAAADQQLFVSTHSSYVLNRLGLDALLLLGTGGVARFGDLTSETVRYFKRLAGYDTLRLVLAEKVVLVEGPSDAIVFERCFRDLKGTGSLDHGVDVISMNGLTFKRALELCRALGRQVVALRDNDGDQPAALLADMDDLVGTRDRHMLVSPVELGATLEPQLLAANGEEVLRKVLRLPATTDVGKWMTRNKSEAALRILEADDSITFPSYIRDAVALVV